MLFSIVIPVYNMGYRINKLIDSLKAQTYSDIEIIIVDDGSQDDSLKICEKIAESDSRIKVYHQDNQGSGPARSLGVAQSVGEYIYFPDADDSIEHRTFEILASKLSEERPDLIVFGYNKIENNGKTILKTYPDKVFTGDELRKNYFECFMSGKYGIQGAPWNKLFRSELIKKNEILFPPLRRHQDEAFIALYMCFAQKVMFIHDILYNYYVNTLEIEWKKYPTNYIESVNGLLECRKNTILTWNRKDIKTRGRVYTQYVNFIIKAILMTFSPKYSYNYSDHIEAIKYNVDNFKLKKVKISELENNLTSRFYFTLFKYRLYRTIYWVTKLKIQRIKSREKK